MKITNIYKLAADDLACYAIALRPEFELARHHDLIMRALEAVERGERDRQMICLPPRHGKSYLTTELFPAYYLGRHPKRSIMIISYEQALADDFGRRARNLVSDPRHTAIFPGCKIHRDSSSVQHFSTTAGGSLYAVGRGGPITGRGAHLVIIDDPLKNAAEARSETIRRTLFEFYSEVVRTRL